MNWISFLGVVSIDAHLEFFTTVVYNERLITANMSHAIICEIQILHLLINIDPFQ